MNVAWKRRLWTLFFGTLGFSPFLLWKNGVWADDPPLSNEDIPQKGVEVLTRGPIHEAFAEPLTVNPRPNPIIHQKPPAAIEELPPDQKPEGTHIQWIPGYFAWDETSDDYIWISGLWRATPPGRQWMPGHWTAQVARALQWGARYRVKPGKRRREFATAEIRVMEVLPLVGAPLEHLEMFLRRIHAAAQDEMGLNRIFHVAQNSGGPLLPVVAFVDKNCRARR